MSSLTQRRAVLASPPPHPSRAMQFRSLGTRRLVAEWAMGNSQQLKDNYGFDFSRQLVMSRLMPLYASEVYPRGADVSAGLNASYSTGNSDGTRPTAYDPFMLPGRGPDTGPQPDVSGYQETGDIGSSQGIALAATSGLDHRHRLRLHAQYGTFDSGSGSFQLAIRREESPFTTLVTGPVINTNTGVVGAAWATLDLPADPTRTGPLGFKWRPIGGANASVGPNLQISMQVEDLDTDVGYSMTSVYAVGGRSMTDMATYMAGMSDAQLRNMILAIVRIQLLRGLSPIMIVGMHEGENQRNDPDWSARNYLTQFLIVWNRIKYGWEKLCGFPLSNLACDVHCGVPISFPQDNKMAAYDAIMADYCRRDPAVSHARYEDTTSFATMTANGSFLDGLHLVPQGYIDIDTNEYAVRMPKVPAINKTLPTISGVRGSGQTLAVVPGTWFQAPTLSYQWYADDVAIAGATGSTFVEQPEQSGKAITVKETASINGMVSSASSAALLDTTTFLADYQGGSFYLNGTTYADEAAFNTAAGITKSGNTRVSAPLQIGTTLAVNGTFDTDASGWTSNNANVTIASVSGKGRITRATSTGAQWVYQAIAAEIGKVYRFTWDVATISGSVLTQRIGNGPGVNIYTSMATAGSKTFDVPTRHATLYFSAGDAGIGQSGVGDLDDVAMIEMVPFPGYVGVPHTVVIAAVTGGTLPSSSHQVLYQEDIGAETDRRRIVWETDGHLWVRMTSGSTEVAALDLGAVAASTSIKVAIAYAQNDFAASLNGGAVVADTSGNCPGAHTMRIGRSFTGETWAGTINKVHHRNTRLANTDLVTLTS